jgi:hypothetical protein
MPHGGAASRKHKEQQMTLAAYTGCRIAVQHDNYRVTRLRPIEIHNAIKQTVEIKLPPFGRAGVDARLGWACFLKGGLSQCERPPFTV